MVVVALEVIPVDECLPLGGGFVANFRFLVKSDSQNA